jgi:ATP-dependent DNA ligase
MQRGLPVMAPVKPMLAKSVPEVPEGEYLYEPKWDVFRRCGSLRRRLFPDRHEKDP